MAKPSNEWMVEMIRRTNEMRLVDRPPGRPRLKKHTFSSELDQDMFEAAMDALSRSEMEKDCWVPEAAAPFAALLVRVLEQTHAEFGPFATRLALRWILEAMEGADAK